MYCSQKLALLLMNFSNELRIMVKSYARTVIQQGRKVTIKYIPISFDSKVYSNSDIKVAHVKATDPRVCWSSKPTTESVSAVLSLPCS